MASATPGGAAAEEGVSLVPLDEWSTAALKTALAAAGSAATVDLGASASDQAELLLAESTVPSLHLDLSDCHVADAALVALGLAPTLVSLDISGTALSSAATLVALARRLPRLASLSVANTPLFDESAVKCKRDALKAFPLLVTFNGARIGAASLQRSVGSAVLRGGASDVAFRDASSCSCLEGEPCVDPENCVNWADRFKVAALAKERGGIGAGRKA